LAEGFLESSNHPLHFFRLQILLFSVEEILDVLLQFVLFAILLGARVSLTQVQQNLEGEASSGRVQISAPADQQEHVGCLEAHFDGKVSRGSEESEDVQICLERNIFFHQH
jgi:hypothetical protein